VRPEAAAPGPDRPPRRRRRLDLALGIALGILLGIAVISAFVFLGEAGPIDAPRIEGVDTGKQQAPAAAGTRSGPEPGR
jgi:hypothetical protein